MGDKDYDQLMCYYLEKNPERREVWGVLRVDDGKQGQSEDKDQCMRPEENLKALRQKNDHETSYTDLTTKGPDQNAEQGDKSVGT